MKLRHPTKSNAALTLIEALVVIGVLIVLALLFLPALAKAHRKASRIECINNLKQIGLSFRLWGGDNADKYPMQVSTAQGGTMELVASGMVFLHFQVMSNELSTPKIVICTHDTNRSEAANFSTGFNNANVSYFVGVDAMDTDPQMILAGDRNLTSNGQPAPPGLLTLHSNAVVGWGSQMHHNLGNILRTDGSVGRLTSADLPRAMNLRTNAPIRLAVP